jgi:hypothetical protein
LGMRGSTRSQNSSETVHDLMAFMKHRYTTSKTTWEDFIYG